MSSNSSDLMNFERYLDRRTSALSRKADIQLDLLQRAASDPKRT
jgi:hypothetical protein